MNSKNVIKNIESEIKKYYKHKKVFKNKKTFNNFCSMYESYMNIYNLIYENKAKLTNYQIEKYCMFIDLKNFYDLTKQNYKAVFSTKFPKNLQYSYYLKKLRKKELYDELEKVENTSIMNLKSENDFKKRKTLIEDNEIIEAIYEFMINWPVPEGEYNELDDVPEKYLNLYKLDKIQGGKKILQYF